MASRPLLKLNVLQYVSIEAATGSKATWNADTVTVF